MMVGNNLNDVQLQQLVDRTIIKADKDFDGKISFSEFTEMVKDLDVIDKLTINCWKDICITLNLNLLCVSYQRILSYLNN